MFREGRTKGLGIVKEVGYDANKPLNPEAKREGERVEGGGSESETPRTAVAAGA